ncbi:MAG: LuxR C-terminal-related transcriptional regulator [Pseudorhodobacter sp.]
MGFIRQISSTPLTISLLIVVQLFCALFFISDVIADFEAMSALNPEYVHLYIEAIASLSLLAAIAFEARHLVHLVRRKERLEKNLAVTKMAVHEVIEMHFDHWNLTAAERDISTFLIKGCPIAEIAKLRSSAEGTIKAHLNSIYRKSETHNQTELLCTLIDALMGEGKPIERA